MMIREARCSCGALRATTRGEPVRVSICHCHDCQRRTGSVFGVQARFPEDAVDVHGASKEYVRTADSGNVVRFNFCPQCGATLFYRFDDMPGWFGILVGAFADAAFPPPQFSVYEERMHGWVTVPAHVEHTP
jgi:hypothetical protein